MRFQRPTGELGWLSTLWAVLGLAAGIYLLVVGKMAFAAIGFAVFVLTLGIWFRLRLCAWLLMALFLVLAAVVLVKEVILARDYLRLGRVLLNIWFSHALYTWLRDRGQDSGT